VKHWRTVAEMAEAWGATIEEVGRAIVLVGVRDSKVHATGEGADRRYSPQAEGLARVEWKASRRGKE